MSSSDSSVRKSEAHRAGIGALVVALMGLVAVVAILIAANREEPREETFERAGTRGTPPAERRALSTEGSTAERSAAEGAAVGPAAAGPVTPSIVTVGRGPDAAWPDAGTAAPSGPAPERRPLVLSPEERYESNAFVLDMFTVRIDNVRIELEEARARGDDRVVRRLETNLVALGEERDRLAARGRDLERTLGRTGMLEARTPPSEADGP